MCNEQDKFNWFIKEVISTGALESRRSSVWIGPGWGCPNIIPFDIPSSLSSLSPTQKRLTFSISDSLNCPRRSKNFRYSGDRKSIRFSLSLVLFTPGIVRLIGIILKATRPLDVMCKLAGFTNGRILFVDGVSVNETENMFRN